MSSFNQKSTYFLIFCISILAVRVMYAGNIKLSFLLWNLFLAWIPYYASLKLNDISSKNKWKFLFTLGLSVLFLPNAIYLVTDLIHLKPREDVPYWYDIVLLFSFSVLGLIYSTLTLIHIEGNLKKLFDKKWTVPIVLFIILSSGYGVYVGRILRWNSWDVFINPLSLLIDCANRLIHPFSYPAAYGFTLVFGMIQGLFWGMFRETKN